MTAMLIALAATLRSALRSRLDLEAEILALRHQLAVLQRQAPCRPRLHQVDRFLWVLLSRLWPDWRRAVHIVTPDTVIRWHRRAREAWPCDTAPRFLLRDRDAIYGSDLRGTAAAMGLEEVLTAPRAPWQNPFVERVIGSLRRECLDDVIVWNERSLRRYLQQCLPYYHTWRTHLALDKDAPVPRQVQPRA